MHRWLITLLVASVLGLCAAFLLLRWWQLAARAPEDVERLSLAPVLAARADDALPEMQSKPEPERDSPPSASVPYSKSASKGDSAGLVNINTATREQLTKLPGIGDVLAGRIIAYRLAHGPFDTLAGLLDVDGIGEGKLEKLKPHATVGR